MKYVCNFLIIVCITMQYSGAACFKSRAPAEGNHITVGDYDLLSHYMIDSEHAGRSPEIATTADTAHVLDFLKTYHDAPDKATATAVYVQQKSDQQIATVARAARAMGIHAQICDTIQDAWLWRVCLSPEYYTPLSTPDVLHLVDQSDVIAVQLGINGHDVASDIQKKSLWQRRENNAENNVIHGEQLNVDDLPTVFPIILELSKQLRDITDERKFGVWDKFFSHHGPTVVGNCLLVADALGIKCFRKLCSACDLGSFEWKERSPFFSITKNDKSDLIRNNVALQRISLDVAWQPGGPKEQIITVPDVNNFLWSPRGTYLVVCTPDKKTLLYHYHDLTKKPLVITNKYKNPVYAWDADEQTLAVAARDQHNILILDLPTQEISCCKTDSYGINALLIDNNNITYAELNGGVKGFKHTGRPYCVKELDGKVCLSFAANPKHPAYLVGSAQGDVYLVSNLSNKVLKTISICPGASIVSLTYSKDGSLVAIHTQNNQKNNLSVYASRRGKICDVNESKNLWPSSKVYDNIYFSPDNQSLYYTVFNNLLQRCCRHYCYQLNERSQSVQYAFDVGAIAFNGQSPLAKIKGSSIAVYPSLQAQKEIMERQLTLSHGALLRCVDADGILSQVITQENFDYDWLPSDYLLACNIVAYPLWCSDKTSPGDTSQAAAE